MKIMRLLVHFKNMLRIDIYKCKQILINFENKKLYENKIVLTINIDALKVLFFCVLDHFVKLG